nr:transposase zinc-binding domain-containing protein [uncultured Desulfobulbus sp.]
MDLATLVHQYYDVFMARFGKTILPDQRKALDAILRCRTPASGELYVQCPDWGASDVYGNPLAIHSPQTAVRVMQPLCIVASL